MTQSKPHSRYQILDFSLAILGSLAIHAAVFGLAIRTTRHAPLSEPPRQETQEQSSNPLPDAGATPPENPAPLTEAKPSPEVEEAQEPVDQPLHPKATQHSPVTRAVRRTHKPKPGREERKASPAKSKHPPKRRT